MAGFVGADPEELARLASRLDTTAQRVTAITREAQLALFTAQWKGADVERLRDTWTRTARPSLTAAATRLSDAARDIRNQAKEQEQASSAADGFAGLGGVGIGGVGIGAIGIGGFAALMQQLEQSRAYAVTVSTAAELIRQIEHGEDPHITLADAQRSGQVGPSISASHDGHLGDVQLHADESALTGARGAADASLVLGLGGLTAAAATSGFAGAEAKANQSATLGIAKVSTSERAMVGAEGNAEGSVTVGPAGVGAKVGAGGFVGGQLNATGTAGIDGAGGTASAGLSAGIGAHADADFQANAGEIKASLSLGATLGLGAQFKISVDVKPVQAASTILHALHL